MIRSRFGAYDAASARAYFKAEAMGEIMPLTDVPIELTDARMTMLMPVAIRAYSIAVAPVWSAINLKTSCRTYRSCASSGAG